MLNSDCQQRKKYETYYFNHCIACSFICKSSINPIYHTEMFVKIMCKRFRSIILHNGTQTTLNLRGPGEAASTSLHYLCSGQKICHVLLPSCDEKFSGSTNSRCIFSEWVKLSINSKKGVENRRIFVYCNEACGPSSRLFCDYVCLLRQD